MIVFSEITLSLFIIELDFRQCDFAYVASNFPYIQLFVQIISSMRLRRLVWPFRWLHCTHRWRFKWTLIDVLITTHIATSFMVCLLSPRCDEILASKSGNWTEIHRRVEILFSCESFLTNKAGIIRHSTEYDRNNFFQTILEWKRSEGFFYVCCLWKRHFDYEKVPSIEHFINLHWTTLFDSF